MNEKYADKQVNAQFDLTGFKATYGIKPTHIKKKQVDPIPILNPLNADFSIVRLANLENLDRLFSQVMIKHDMNIAVPLLCGSYPIPPFDGGVIIQYGRTTSSDPIMK